MVSGRETYPHSPDLYQKLFRACLPCRTWVGCHAGGLRRLGRLADDVTRQLKIKAHAVFDPIWKDDRMKRNQAYPWLREQLGLSEIDCHIGWISDEDLRRVVEICQGTMA